MKPLMIVLNMAIEPFGVGLFRDDEIATEYYQCSTRHFSESILPIVENMCKKNNEEIANVRAIGVVVGPGSYTGLRISIATAKTIAIALNIPLFGINSFEVIARQVPFIDQLFGVVIPSKKKCIYLQLFNAHSFPSKSIVSDPIFLTMSEWEKLLLKLESPLTFFGVLDKSFLTSINQHSHISYRHLDIRCTTIAEHVNTCIIEKKESIVDTINPFYFHEPYIGIIKKKKNRKNV